MTVLGVGTGEGILWAVSPLILGAQYAWFEQVQRQVPEPYLDEVFHIPQANAYYKGNWTHWDDKITTPPGLYLYSIAVTRPFVSASPGILSATNLRWTNFILTYMLMLVCVLWRRTAPGIVSLRRKASLHGLSFVTFPLLFFFSALYYTDVFAAFSVMCTYTVWQAGTSSTGRRRIVLQILHLIFGTISLTSRQTNIFWSAVFLGGLQVVNTIKQSTRIHDPPITDAYFEDVPITVISLTSSAVSMIPQLLLDLWPQMALLAEFAVFILWNGGVVLGDKSNHTAGIHVAQMLYFWPFLVFFSWPIILPHLAHFIQSFKRLPRSWLVAVVLPGMLTVVHFNTIIHPFLLADNRHYTFYVFKLLRSNPWLWYIMTPIYAVCAWLSIQALGGRMSYSGGPGVKGSRSRRLSTSSGPGDAAELEVHGTRTSFALVWLISTALSLITAPLVEPRYFIIPWLIWRLHVGSPEDILNDTNTSAQNASILSTRLDQLLTFVAQRSRLLELIWYMAINLVTCRLFLYNGFQWPQEPGNVQRFMW